MREPTIMKPIIFVNFDGHTVVWQSAGWKNDKELMAAARKAINEGEFPEDVMRLLREAGFQVNVH
jgi:hypothetical protein